MSWSGFVTKASSKMKLMSVVGDAESQECVLLTTAYSLAGIHLHRMQPASIVHATNSVSIITLIVRRLYISENIVMNATLHFCHIVYIELSKSYT